jgi:hypothetical protein
VTLTNTVEKWSPELSSWLTTVREGGSSLLSPRCPQYLRPSYVPAWLLELQPLHSISRDRKATIFT